MAETQEETSGSECTTSDAQLEQHQPRNEQECEQEEDDCDNDGADFEMVMTEGVKTGKCKWFNGTKGWGFVTLTEGGHDVFVHQSILQMKGFRQLGEAEEVEIEFRLTEKGLEAVKVTGPNGNDCRGSKGPHPTKRVRKIRCYNCGEFKNHVASKCLQPPQPKRCHRCKSSEHLIADCPEKADKISIDDGPVSSHRDVAISDTATQHNPTSIATIDEESYFFPDGNVVLTPEV